MATSKTTKAKAAAANTNTAQTTTDAVISLQSVIDATKADGFVYTAAEFHQPLIEQGLVEVNPEMTDEHGNLATRATEKALNPVTEQTNEPTASAKPKFEIESDVAIPERTRVSTGLRAGRAPVYPFDGLEIGQSFFVPNVGDKSAAKAMASTVAGANARYVEEIAGETRTNRKGNVVPATKQLRKFKIFDTERKIVVDGVEQVQKGARVFRVKLDNETLQS